MAAGVNVNHRAVQPLDPDAHPKKRFIPGNRGET
jgi:hypothetical protein